jgi:hypothetical protein
LVRIVDQERQSNTTTRQNTKYVRLSRLTVPDKVRLESLTYDSS